MASQERARCLGRMPGADREAGVRSDLELQQRDLPLTAVADNAWTSGRSGFQKAPQRNPGSTRAAQCATISKENSPYDAWDPRASGIFRKLPHPPHAAMHGVYGTAPGCQSTPTPAAIHFIWGNELKARSSPHHDEPLHIVQCEVESLCELRSQILDVGCVKDRRASHYDILRKRS